MKPRIGIYFHARKSSGGIYQYSLILLRALASVRAKMPYDVVIFYASPDFPREEFESTGWEFIFTGHRVAERIEAAVPESLLQYGRFAGSMIEQFWTRLDRPRKNLRLKRIFGQHTINLMIYPSPRRESFESGIPYVIVIHDIQHRLQPHFPEVSKFGEWRRRDYVIKNSIQQAVLVVAESEIGKEDVVRLYGIDGRKVEVLPYIPAIETLSSGKEDEVEGLKDRYGLPEEFLFYPAQFWPHKNHYRLLQSIKLIQQHKGIRIPAVFVGSAQKTWGEFQKVMRLVRKEGLQRQVRYLAYVPPSDMPMFYKAAKFLVMPTFFGPTNIPVLEAFSLGCPVITSDIRGIREQVGDAALLIDPNSVEDIADKIFHLWSDEDLREELIQRGFRKSDSWTIDDFAERLITILQETLGLGAGGCKV